MKKLFVLVIACLVMNFGAKAQADNFVAFEWDILRLGYAIPTSNNFNGGILFGGEPRFNIKDDLSIGLRYEFAVLAANFEKNSVDVGFSTSYAFIADHYFNSEDSRRAFVGSGLGRFLGASVSVTDEVGNETEIGAGRGFGIIPRVGYEIGHLRIILEYNLVFKKGITNYLGLSVAGTLWGGRK